MNRNLALLALTGILTLASCGQNNDSTPTCTTGQNLVNGVCQVTPGVLSITNPNNYAVTVKDANGNVVDSSKYAALAPGNYSVTFHKDGYVDQSSAAVITAGQTTTIVAPTLSAVSATTGAVHFVNPNGYTTTVKDSNGTVIPVASYTALAPGDYSVTFSADGYVAQNATFTVTAGQTATVVAPTLTKEIVTPIDTKGKSYYIDASGNPVQITDMTTSHFHFNAWMRDTAGAGINPAQVGIGDAGSVDDAALTSDNNEKYEVAPLNHQNILAAYMTYTPDNGTTWYPVIGADVRWDITEQTGGVRFSAADDGANDSGAMRGQDINANALSALTWTNRAGNSNISYPSSAKYPIYNLTGVNTPDKTGYSWTALNHDPSYDYASARVRVIGYVNGQEIEKHWLTKEFAPSAHLTIAKTVNNANPAAPNEARTFTITVKNDGQGDASAINLNDVLKTGNADLYSVTNIAADGTVTTGPTANANKGFDSTFDLAAGASRVFTFTASATDSGQFCDTATVGSYTNGAFGLVTPGVTAGQEALSAQACMTVQAPKLTVIKTLVDANGNPLADQTVAANQNANIRITLTNNGDGAANNVVLTDALGNLTNGAVASAYTLGNVAPATGVTMNGTTGFTAAGQTIAPGASVTYTFPAQASTDGRYCDVASFTSDNAGTGSDDACFTVATAHLAITKVNGPKADLRAGSQFTSTITVSNTGNATATNVNVKDVIDAATGSGSAFYGSGLYTVTGTAQQGSMSYDASSRTATIIPTTVSIPAGGNLTMTVTSTVPAGTAPGSYCDVATFTSDNAGTGNAQDCITVAANLPTHIQSGDSVDPLKANNTDVSTITFTSFVERTANENATNHNWYFNFGTTDPANYNGQAGVFNFSNVRVIYDAAPTYDPTTGIITSDYNHAGAQDITSQVQLSATSGTGLLTVTAPSFSMVPGSVMYIRTDVTTNAVSAAGFNSVGRWETSGAYDSVRKINQAAENTTTIPSN